MLAPTTSMTGQRESLLATSVATVSDVVTGMLPDPAAWKAALDEVMNAAKAGPDAAPEKIASLPTTIMTTRSQFPALPKATMSVT